MTWFVFTAIRNNIEINEKIPAEHCMQAILELRNMGCTHILIDREIPFE